MARSCPTCATENPYFSSANDEICACCDHLVAARNEARTAYEQVDEADVTGECLHCGNVRRLIDGRCCSGRLRP